MKTNDSVLISADQIQIRVKELAQKISEDFKGGEITVIGVLKGSFVFMADLIRSISVPLTCDFLRVSSYANNKSSDNLRLVFDLTQPIFNRNILLVEDIIDSGRTLDFLLEHLSQKSPESIKVCSLLTKNLRPDLKDKIDYVGFEIPNHYVIGYGMDNDGLERNLSEIRIVKN